MAGGPIAARTGMDQQAAGTHRAGDGPRVRPLSGGEWPELSMGEASGRPECRREQAMDARWCASQVTQPQSLSMAIHASGQCLEVVNA